MNYLKIIRLLEKEYPKAGIQLKYRNKMQLLVAVILSAQCTDERVNKVTEKLFKKYRTVKDFAKANQKELEKQIFSTGFYKNKAKNIILTAKTLQNKFNGKIPSTMNELLLLPGVARKTANVVLQNGFNKVEGIVVDTHVKRLSNRIGLSFEKTPEKIEKDLMKKINKKHWKKISNLLIFHGRKVCKAKRPLCQKCVLNKQCISAFKF